ncbi:MULTISPECIES: DUF2157 domain-containing protein [Pontibacillus]|uniref:DUF2157 domain-containing protein n=1 Tax=Pontibacillus chungwhensis TaxID=265426 RepID=A0ABY8V155_9BACI|nr:DUF2157 domain-containing protein [Pontibacillus chungwhensis]MCD5325015.1 DUF2157 domain-containing protein [Pontibacillus sp. HN14]WIF98967.1 DUF2157 domain-containing protein [Pontibacillus chungwhensis]
MKRSWVEKEGAVWVEEGIISNEQYEQLLKRYPNRNSRGLLAMFGGVFIGLGFLTFVASNWPVMPNLVKMAILLIALVGFYFFGDRAYQKGSKALGTSFYAIGILLFGAAMILTGQMYHYMSTHATTFFLWGLAALLIYGVRRERALLYLAFVILTAGQIYSWMTYGEAHIGIFLLFVLGGGFEVVRLRRDSLGLLYGFLYVLQSLVLVFAGGSDYVWLLFLWLGVYVGASLRFFNLPSLQMTMVGAAFLLKAIEVFLLDSWVMEELEVHVVFLIAQLLLIGLLVLLTKDRVVSVLNLLLFLPVVYIGEGGGIVALILLYALSIGYLILGTQRVSAHLVNFGTGAFLISTLIAYVQLAWDFLNKSVFFFIGGILLFGLSYVLHKGRHRLSGEEKGGGE